MATITAQGRDFSVGPAEVRCYEDIAAVRGDDAAEAVLVKAFAWMPLVKRRHPMARGFQREREPDVVIEALLCASEVPRDEIQRVAERYAKRGQRPHWDFARFSRRDGVEPSPTEPDSAPSPTARAAVVRDIEVETQFTTWAAVRRQEGDRQITRREHQLVLRFKSHLERQGFKVISKAIDVGDGGTLGVDLFDASRGHLIEAKDTPSREKIRMAIGQIADYSRFVGPNASAVLVSIRPPSDLEELLESRELAVIWEDEERFIDNANGKFV